MATAKFQCVGVLQDADSTVKKEVKQAKEESDESSDGDKDDQALDYGYLEKANIAKEEDDCFYKLNEAFDTKFSGVESNISVIHSRYCQVRKLYKNQVVNDLNSIPLDSAHPNFDHADRIVLFHNGSIANFTDLKASLSVMGIKIPSNVSMDNLTDS